MRSSFLGQEPFGMAGLWKRWKAPKTDHWGPTFAVITGEPNGLMAPIHDRMTVFLKPRDYAQCLGPSERPPLHLLRILSPEGMRIRQIESSMINSAQVNLWILIDRLAPR